MLNRYKNPEYTQLCTSDEILLAIELIGDGRITDKSSEAFRIWEYPTPGEAYRVGSLAWSLASDTVEQLQWCNATYFRVK